jgi:hypothetical protein
MKEPIDMNEAEMRARFDFSKATRGRFADRYRNGHTVTLLDHDPDEDDTTQPTEIDETTRQSGMRIFETQIREAGLRLDEPSKNDAFDYVIRAEPEGGRRGVSYPVKLKTSIHEVFALYRKDSEIPHLLVAYVWHAKGASEPEIYALSYEEALQIVRSKPYRNSKSWNEDGGYSVTHSGAELKEMLKDHRMTPDKWHQRLQSI